MAPGEQPYVVGLPDEFDLTEDQARALNVDALVADASLEHGQFDCQRRLAAARDEAQERGDEAAAIAYQLLVVATGMMLSDDRRAPFGRYVSGHDGENRRWHSPLPADLRDRHVGALLAINETITTPVLRGHLADILWHRLYPRKAEHAQTAVAAHLQVAEATFAPDHWTISERYLSRAYRLSRLLGTRSSAFAATLRMAWAFLDRLDATDPLFYTHRIISRIFDTLTEAQSEALLERVKRIAESSDANYAFERARQYYDVAVRLARRLRQKGPVDALRFARAETYTRQADLAANEVMRAHYLRLGRRALLDAGASRDQIERISAALDDAQILSVSEMTEIATEIRTEPAPDGILERIRGKEPMEALWILAGSSILLRKKTAVRVAADYISRFHFRYGFGRAKVNRDGRLQGTFAGSLGASDEERRNALRGAMHDQAAQARLASVLGTIEPARQILVIEHEYTLADIYEGIQNRPLIPQGHSLLWAKGVYAGLMGEFDIAVHILAPQIENALREVLRRRRVVVIEELDGYQRVQSVADVLRHPVAPAAFGEDYVFTLDSVLGDRMGANVRNEVAHGLVNDAAAGGVESAFLWWLALRLLRAYGPDPLARPPTTGDDARPDVSGG